jgi:glycosyltransferase involved in cell wall biosynthesis
LSGRTCHFLPTTRRLPVGKATKAVIRKGKRNYLFIGRYHPNKGPDVLLEAVSRLDEKTRDLAHFHFFGGGPLENGLRAFVKEHEIDKSISINGYINEQEAAGFLRSCDALIIPSRIESIPVVLSDALQTGCRIIATDVGDMGILLRREHAGRVVVPESPQFLALAIREDIFEKQDFKEGSKRLAELFDLSKSVEKFVSAHFGNLSERLPSQCGSMESLNYDRP